MKPDFDLTDRVAVVTGAAGKLGPVWVDTLLSAGAVVVAITLPGTERDESLTPLLERGTEIILADVRERRDLHRVLAAVESRYGVPHILVANAGVDVPPSARGCADLEAIQPEEVAETLATNVLGTFLSLQVFGSAMARAGRGAIIVIGSMYATVAPDPYLYDHLTPPFVKPPAYGASKAAAVQMATQFAGLWGEYGVRVNSLSPGGVAGAQDSEFKSKYCGRTPLRRMAMSSDLAGPLLFLASEASAYVTGLDLRVDGGFCCW